MTKRTDKLAADLAELRRIPGAYAVAAQAIQGDGRWSDAHKRDLLAGLQYETSADAKAQARRVREAAQKALAATREDLAKAHRQAEGAWNYQRLEFLRAELGAKLAAPADPLRKDTPTRRALAEYRRYAAAGDAEALRALRLAAVPLLALADADDPQAADLRRYFADDERQERAPVADLEAQAADLVKLAEAIDTEILHLEEAVTGYQRHPVFQAISPWEAEILGRTPQNTGRLGTKETSVIVG